jgi:4-aminobutyrate aminotransferase-like enzyme
LLPHWLACRPLVGLWGCPITCELQPAAPQYQPSSRHFMPLRTSLPQCLLPPVMIVDGKIQYLFDETGRRYLDVTEGCC